ncbi:MAG: hypothetical protein V1809_02735 [Planctomycetota bacterium]
MIVTMPQREMTTRQTAAAPRVSQISQILRTVAGESPIPLPAFVPVLIRPVRSSREMDAVYRLVHDTFLERGYCASQPDGRLIHYPHLDHIPETTVLAAVLKGEIVGTISYTFDGPAGLHTDKDFKAECDVIRAEGKRLGASWRIATRNRFRYEKEVVMALIRTTVHYILDSGVETSVFTFNPRHERVYQRMLNMTTVTRSAGTDGLSNAPAVLMRMETENIPAKWREGYRAGSILPKTYLDDVRVAV